MTKPAAIMTRAPTTIAPPDATASDEPAIPVTVANTSGLAKASDTIVANVLMTVTPTDVWTAAVARFVAGC